METSLPSTTGQATSPAATIVPLSTQPSQVALTPPRIVAAAPSSTRPNGTDGCDPPNVTTYSAAQLFDRFTDTAWMTVGSGVGSTILFTLDSPSQVTVVGLIAGYDKVDPCRGFDRFFDLRRIVLVRWTFDDGTSVDQLFDPNVRTMQYVTLPTVATTRFVGLTILETTAPGNGDLDYAPISEVEIR